MYWSFSDLDVIYFSRMFSHCTSCEFLTVYSSHKICLISKVCETYLLVLNNQNDVTTQYVYLIFIHDH